MNRRLLLATAVVAALAACRGRTTIAETSDASVDHALPSAIAPSALGGGPTSDESVYSTSAALAVLTSARCHRARVCGGEEGNCAGEAAADHGDELTNCDKGVDANALSDCAQHVRATGCEAAIALPETCTASALCLPR